VRNKKKFLTHLLLYTKQSYLVCTYFSQKLSFLIFTIASLWYFFGCFLFTFLESYIPVSFFEKILIISLYFVLTTYNILVPSLSVTFLSKTSLWSFFKYFSFFLFFFFFFSVYFHFSVFFHALVSVVFLVFYIACLKQQASTISSRQA